jgi:hypothetical protein
MNQRVYEDREKQYIDNSDIPFPNDWTSERILELIDKNQTMVGRCLVELLKRQDEDEKISKMTTRSNGRGFNKIDAEFLTSLAQYFIRTNRLTDTQLFYARKKLRKYARQLAWIANYNVFLRMDHMMSLIEGDEFNG